MYLDGDTPTTYGRLVSWDDDHDAKERLNISPHWAIDPGQGLLSLEIQDRIMHFLVECCRSILHDVSELGSVANPPHPVSSQPLAATIDASEYPTTVALAIERQYRAPAAFDYKRMRSIMGAKCHEAEDHIWSLREDPSYFADTLLEWSEHRSERISSRNGKDHSVGWKKTQNHAVFWERVIAWATADAYASLIDWNILEKQLSLLQELSEKHCEAISPEKRLPPEYLQALLNFREM